MRPRFTRKPVTSDANHARILYVIDDELEVRRSLEYLLSTYGIAVISFSAGTEFLARLPDLVAGPLIVDMRMTGMNGLQLLEELRLRNIQWPIIVLTGHGDVPVAVTAMKLGATDFLEKPIDLHRIEAILTEAFVSLDQGECERSTGDAAQARFATLTGRQNDVMDGLMRGLSNKQVAHLLSLSPRTVEMHRAAALSRLAVRTIAEVVTLKNTGKHS